MTHEAYPTIPPRFHELNDGAAHTVSRTAVNAKLPKMAKVELGLDTVQRAAVPDDRVDWDTDFPDYNPPVIDLPRGATSFRKEGDKPDPADPAQIAEFASLETSHVRRDQNQWPLNPVGRTGMRGRGMLDKWGATPAADPILTRDSPETGKLEALLIQRGDTGEWALPGGKVDDGEEPWEAAARELVEEAGVRGVDLDFSRAPVVYAGYVDDSRNTDNAWMESTALHLHLDGQQAQAVTIEAGSDADAARWVPVNDELYGNLFASHGQYLRLAVDGASSGNA